MTNNTTNNKTTTTTAPIQDDEQGAPPQDHEFLEMNRDEAMNRLRVDTEDLDLQQHLKNHDHDDGKNHHGASIITVATNNGQSSSPTSSIVKYSIEEEEEEDNADDDNDNPFAIHTMDDDSDDEKGLSRYTFELDHDNHAYDSLHTSQYQYEYKNNNAASPSSSSSQQQQQQQHSPSTKSLLSNLKISNLLQTHRQQLRRRRAERAISASASNSIRGRIMLIVSPYCDITERKGMLLIVLLAMLFVLLYYSMSFNAFYQDVIWKTGLVVLVVRILHRPMYWLIWGRVVEQRRLAAMRVYDGLNGEMATAGRRHSHVLYAVADSHDDVDHDHDHNGNGVDHHDLDVHVVDGETGQIGGVVV
eukprot:CAMPEP_0196824670 /NCGR_PEP_ID=MMETSP1362-20130617/92618_1 /TAXON_ID=163516 /ORGANISM="Leptocylindrus danicus, Strain CCMP1856" /LENGTH=359 /DNA_ID=CAMNT_0042204993 /DNA_START=1381 /DNA_END=2460 /DNA_ORIENTATION=+